VKDERRPGVKLGTWTKHPSYFRRFPSQAKTEEQAVDNALNCICPVCGGPLVPVFPDRFSIVACPNRRCPFAFFDGLEGIKEPGRCF